MKQDNMQKTHHYRPYEDHKPPRLVPDEPESIEVGVIVDGEHCKGYYNHDEKNWWVNFGGISIGHRLIDRDELSSWYYFPTPLSKEESYITRCRGKILSNGFCDTCFQVSETTSALCGRYIKISKEESQPTKQKVWLVMTQQLLIAGCFSSEEKAIKYAAESKCIVQEIEVY